MQQLVREGTLYRDNNRRYCLYESGFPVEQTITLTSGCSLEIWLNREWVTGHVEGDGQDYWLFAYRGGRFLLSERMKARYIIH
ncbi:hypothetical protein KDW_40510 [Dictyobacter vulcani]|uniref:DUF5348 domain-containing protein n=1 Tax=Dictyobacter vulcani TaxID=2607529 RepID=A0A5J4KUW9_9CHLR|nr:DUF5348 domain-containing protein [Dictyobacter vulcani]GER89889.1 hypothetical protein KDW_40510 [Dictyobacter vulcani]